MIGREVGGRYFIVEKISGGRGSLYLAKDLRTGKRRAVKILSETSRSEAAFWGDLDHPMLPQMVDCVEEEGCVFLVMEYLQGKNLKELLKHHGPWQEKQVLSWARELCTVLEYLHSRKPPIIHGDIKPENLMLTREGRLYLVDLGSAAKGYRTDFRQCTGTKGYAAPEQYRGELYPASDLYAFGKTMEQLMERHAGSKCSRIFQKCCRERPEERWPSFQAVESQLARAGREGVFRKTAMGIGLGIAVLVIAMWRVRTPVKTVERQIPVPVTVTTTVTKTVSVTEKLSQEDKGTHFLEELTELQPLLKLGLQQAAAGEGQQVLDEALRRLKEMENIYEEQKTWCRVRLLRIQAEEAGKGIGAGKALYEEALEKYPDERELYSQFGCWLCSTGEAVRSETLYHQAEGRFGQLDTYLEERWKEMLDEEREEEVNKKTNKQE